MTYERWGTVPARTGRPACRHDLDLIWRYNVCRCSSACRIISMKELAVDPIEFTEVACASTNVASPR